MNSRQADYTAPAASVVVDRTSPTVGARLEAHKQLIRENADHLLGYPESGHFDYQPVIDFMDFNVDNLGDPFADLLYGVNSAEFEREVIGYFADLYDLEPNESWGYVTSSGSEGNLYGLYLAREAQPDAILYYSSHSHYSVPKAARLLRVDAEIVPASKDGEIDYRALELAIQRNDGWPVIINANIGTTITGAIDDVDKILDILHANNVEEFYIHCDAALSGMMLPFMKNAPQITFEKEIGSVTVSGHKFMGAPYPCGIVVARSEHVARIRTQIEYIGGIDATIGGSRNGQAPLYLWHAIRSRDFEKEVQTSMEMADYLCEQLEEMGYPWRRNKFSNTVVFKEPSDAIVRKWQLARSDGEAHIITVPHASKAKLDAFLDELRADFGWIVL